MVDLMKELIVFKSVHDYILSFFLLPISYCGFLYLILDLTLSREDELTAEFLLLLLIFHLLLYQFGDVSNAHFLIYFFIQIQPFVFLVLLFFQTKSSLAETLPLLFDCMVQKFSCIFTILDSLYPLAKVTPILDDILFLLKLSSSMAKSYNWSETG